MPLPKAPPAGASAGPAAPECWLCGEAALEAESDLVEVFCNQGDCCDASGSRYHRDCMLAHIEKAGRVRKTHGGATDMRQIARMELSGFHCVHSRRDDDPCKGRMKGSLLILQVKKKAAAKPAAAATPAHKPQAAKPAAPSRKAPRNAYASHDTSRLRAAPVAGDPAGAAHRGTHEPPVGADFADVDAENRRRAAKAARAVAHQNAKAAKPLGASNGGGDAGRQAGGQGGKSPWWEQIQRMDDSYEPKGFNSLVAPSGFSVPAPNPWGSPAAGFDNGAAQHGASPTGGPSNGGLPTGGDYNQGGDAHPGAGDAMSDAQLAQYYSDGAQDALDGRDPDALFAQLLEMGYSEEDSHEVAFRCSSIEAAVEAINNKTDPAFLAELDAQYQAAVAAQAPPMARAGALPPPQSAAALAADAAAAAQLEAADLAAARGARPADDGWKTVKTRAQQKTAGSTGSGSGAKAPALPKDAGAVLMGLFRSKKLRLADVPPPVVAALAQAPDGVAYECMRSLEDSLRRGNTIRSPASWLLNAARILTEQYRLCSLTDSDDDDDSWSDTGSRSGGSPAGSSFGGSFSGSSWSGARRQAPPARAEQHGWQAPRAPPVQQKPYAAPPVAAPPVAVDAGRWPSLAEAPGTPDPFQYAQQPRYQDAFTPPAALHVPVAPSPPPQPVYAAPPPVYAAPQPFAGGDDDDLEFMMNALAMR